MAKARKFAVVGSRSVGKSSMIVRFVEDYFVESYYPTIENQFNKSIIYKNQEYEIEILDTAGQDEFSMINEKHLIGIHGYLLVYSVTSRQSFEVIEIIRDKILTAIGTDNILMVLVGNKSDLNFQRQVETAEGEALAKKFNCKFLETSVKDNLNVNKSFENLLDEIESIQNPEIKFYPQHAIFLTPVMSKKVKSLVGPGPLTSKEGVPYDYIVIIDSGSKGSRVYIYNWLNPAGALSKGIDLSQGIKQKDLKLIRRFTRDDDGSDSDSDDEDGDKNKDTADKKPTFKLPQINNLKKWKAKVTPGISSFNNSPQKIGKHHLRELLKLASQVVPKSQHYRTPIFLHSTAGMRLLTPTEQHKMLDTVCKYLTSNSDFFLPDCESHINVIEGDVEGLYGWLAINYMVGTFDDSTNHQHGKNHTTYGLLDMGGASTQVVFQPNSTEIEEHSNNLYRIKLAEVPKNMQGDLGSGYAPPAALTFDVYSDSFLGFGMSQAYNKYQASLVAASDSSPSGLFSYYRSPIEDPCMPKGYRSTTQVDENKYDFIGTSDFKLCMTSIFPVIKNSTHGQPSETSENCKESSDGTEVSSCLLNDLIPAFDFDVNHFFGVSGYWNALSKLMAYDNGSDDKTKRHESASSRIQIRKKSKSKSKSESDYDYKIIYDRTSKICGQSFSGLLELNSLKKDKDKITDDELSKLCFESSWILNFLHLGLGFPRFGIDEIVKPDKFKSLQLVDKVNGADFSWTLGRALLYANDEYVQAFNNVSDQQVERSGFLYTAASPVFHYGSEKKDVVARPEYVTPDPDAKYTYFDYEKDTTAYENESSWDIEPHRWYGIMIFVMLLSFIFWLLVGKEGRIRVINHMKYIPKAMYTRFRSKFGSYASVPELGSWW